MFSFVPRAYHIIAWSRIVSAVKTLVRSPGFAAIAIVTLALGIGANTAIFTLLYSAALRPLPVRDADQLVNVYQQFHGRFAREVHGFGSQVSYLEFESYTQARSLASAAVYATTEFASSDSPANLLPGAFVSCGYFQTLQARIEIGRGFADECSQSGSSRVAVISHRLWQSRFGGDARAIGRRIDLNREPLTVVGVAEPSFLGIDVESVDVWVPATIEPALHHEADSLVTHDASWMTLVARLRPHTSLAAARAELATIAQRRDLDYPGRQTTVIVTPAAYLNFPEVHHRGAPIVALLVMLGLLLAAVTCANVMNLLLARGLVRRREIGIRLALGASRRRLVEQLLTEALVLATVAAAGGIGLAFLLPVAAAHVLPIVGLQIDLAPNARVFGFAVMLSWATVLVFAALPALEATRLDVLSMFKGLMAVGGRRIGQSQLRSVVVGVQVAASALLISVAVDVGQAAQRLSGTDLGFATKNVTAFELDLGQVGYSNERSHSIRQLIAARLAALPNVEAVGFASQLPLVGQNIANVEVLEPGRGTWVSLRQTALTFATRGYLNVLRMRLLEGTMTDVASQSSRSNLTAVVNAAFADAVCRHDCIGKRIRVNADQYEISGVVSDARLVSIASDREPFVFLEPSSSADLAIVVRTRSPGGLLDETMRSLVREIDPNLLVRPDRFEDRLAEVLRPARLTAATAAIIGAMAFVLALVGIYGTVSYGVRQRGPEMAVRLALGSTRSSIVALVMREGSKPVLIGVSTGVALAIGGGVLLRSFLIGESGLDATVYVLTATLSLMVCYSAMIAPAAWASRLDPARTLRAD